MAGLLNRTLLIHDDVKETRKNVDYSGSIDFEHINRCFGKDRVMTTTQYKEKYKMEVEIDEAICWSKLCGDWNKEDLARSPYFYEDWPSIRMAKGAIARQGPTCCPSLSRRGIKDHFGAAKGRVLTLGEMFRLEVREYSGWSRYYLPFPRGQGCDNMLSLIPSEFVMSSARSFVKEIFLGDPFIAVHWRRGDFGTHCNATVQRGCWLPLRSVAYCIATKAQNHGVKQVYIATNENFLKVCFSALGLFLCFCKPGLRHF